MRRKLENERRALTVFVSKFDSLGLGSDKSSSGHSRPINLPMPSTGGALATFERRQLRRPLSSHPLLSRISDVTVKADNEDIPSASEDSTGASATSVSTVVLDDNSNSPLRHGHSRERIHLQALNHPRLLDLAIPEEIENCMLNVSFDEDEVEEQLLGLGEGDMSVCFVGFGVAGQIAKFEGRKRETLGNKENIHPSVV